MSEPATPGSIPRPLAATPESVELNLDLGELDDEPAELYSLATVVNVACGGHAGDDASMRRARDRALSTGAAIAAHPSYLDRAGFGRGPRHAPAGAVRELVRAQCARLVGLCAERGAPVVAVKPHGALYHDACADDGYADALILGLADALGPGPSVVGLPGSALERRAAAAGRAFQAEGFADRGYGPGGGLLRRGEPGALLERPEDCARQALRLAGSGRCATLCVHGDGPSALATARAVRRALEVAGLLRVRPPAQQRGAP